MFSCVYKLKSFGFIAILCPLGKPLQDSISLTICVPPVCVASYSAIQKCGIGEKERLPYCLITLKPKSLTLTISPVFITFVLICYSKDTKRIYTGQVNNKLFSPRSVINNNSKQKKRATPQQPSQTQTMKTTTTRNSLCLFP